MYLIVNASVILNVGLLGFNLYSYTMAILSSMGECVMYIIISIKQKILALNLLTRAHTDYL